MPGKSNYFQTKVLNWALNAVAMGTAPATPYVSLHSADPTEAGGGAEVTTTIRTAGRVAGSFGAVTSGSGPDSVSNDVAVEFGVAVGGAEVTHFGIWDAQVAGNLLYFGPLTTPRTVIAGQNVLFPIGEIDITEA